METTVLRTPSTASRQRWRPKVRFYVISISHGVDLYTTGYLVIAPNLLGHALRKPGVDFKIQTLADDLLPYFEDAEYDIIIGHSMGGLVVLSLLKYLPKDRPVSVVLIDSTLEMTAEQKVERRVRWSEDVKSNRSAEDYAALNPLWTREDAIWRVLGIQIGRATNVVDHIDVSLIASSRRR